MSSLYMRAVQEQPLHESYPEDPLYGSVHVQLFHGSCPGEASTRELSMSSLYMRTVQERPLHESCLRAASARELFRSSFYTRVFHEQPIHRSCIAYTRELSMGSPTGSSPGTASTWELPGGSLNTGAGQEEFSTRKLARGSLYMEAVLKEAASTVHERVQEQPIHESCPRDIN
jgi:hypothetical protein